jgi:uncharacterized membrane protein YkoI
MKSTLAALSVLALAGCYDPMPRNEIGDDFQRMESRVIVHEERPSSSPAELAAACKVSLAAAIETALAKVKGSALSAEIEIENGKAHIDVTILSEGKLWEVEIDGTTGAVNEVEQEDDDDDDDDEDSDDD